MKTLVSVLVLEVELKLSNFDKVVTSCQEVVPNLLTTCAKQCEYILLMACWQICYKM